MAAMPRFRLLCLVSVLLLCPVLCADPMGTVEGGGNLRLADEHRTISLVSERLVFEPQLGTTRVTARLDFENTAEACTVRMGFPIVAVHPGSGQDFLRALTVRLDGGEPLEVTKRAQATPLDLASGRIYCGWHYFSVPFADHGKLRMECSYEVAGGWPQVPYVLATGGTWKGPIHDFELEVRLGERLDWNNLQLTGDGQPLAYQEQGGGLRWHCTDYEGKPGLLWFSARPGPAQVTVDGMDLRGADARGLLAGEVRSGYHRPCFWRQGRVLVSLDLLRELLLLDSVSFPEHDAATLPPATARARWSGGECQLPALRIPALSGRDGEPIGVAYVDPAPAFQCFGGRLEHRRNARGDLEVSLVSVPDTPARARTAALAETLAGGFRLRALRYLAAREPVALAELARQIGARPQEDPTVLLALVGYAAEDAGPALTPSAVVPRLRLWRGLSALQTVLSVAQAFPDDAVLRGAGLVLRTLDPEAARAALLDKLSSGGPDDRTRGLLLRLLALPGTCQQLVAVLQANADRVTLGNGALTLGYLGDDDAIPFLQELVRHYEPVNNGVGDSAARALGLMGTAQALSACAEMLPEPRRTKWTTGLLLEGLQRAAGVVPDHPWYYQTRPVWACSLTPAEARATVLPLARRAQETLPAETHLTGQGPLADALRKVIAACEGNTVSAAAPRSPAP